MLGKWGGKLFFSAVVFVFWLGAGGTGIEARAARLVSSELLERAGLKTVWENELPIKKGESLERLIIVGDCVYGLSSQNYMICLERQEGEVIFGRSIAAAGLPVVGLELYGGRLMSLVGGRFVEINPKTGEKVSSYYPGFGIVCPVVRNRSYLYVAGVDHRLHILRFADKVEMFEVSGGDESLISSVIAEEGRVIFATEGGNVVSIQPNRPVKLWQFNAAGGIVGPVVKEGGSVFFACRDMCVYRVDMVHERLAKLVWKYQMNGMLDEGPYVTGRVVYQRAGAKGLAAVDKKRGELLWQLVEGSDLLAEAKGKAYVITRRKTLTVMDNHRCRRVYRVNFAGVSRYAVNTQDAKMYIADAGGRIACLEPVK